MGDFLIIPCLNCIEISQKQAWRPLIYFAWMKSMYFLEYVCRFSRKSHYFRILGVSHLNLVPTYSPCTKSLCPESCLNIKLPSSHDEDERASRPSYLFDGMRILSKTVLTLTRRRVAFCNWNNTCKTELKVHTKPVWCNEVFISPWWRHQMEASSALLALCEENPPVNSGFPSEMPVMWSFGLFFDLHRNKQLSKRSRRWWFETLSHSLWHHCNCSGYFYRTCIFHCLRCS